MNPSRRRFLFGATAVLVATPAAAIAAIKSAPIDIRAFGAIPDGLVLKNEPASIMPGMITYTNALGGKPMFMPAFEVPSRNLRAMS